MNNNIKYIISARVISDIGNWIDRIAILTLVYSINNTVISMSLVSLLTVIPCILLSPIAGKVADKYNQKNIMLIGDFTRAILVFLIPFLQQYVLYILLIISSISTFADVCNDSIIPCVTNKESIGKLNSLNSSVSSIIMVIGPSISGILIASLGVKYCFFIDSISFIVSFMLISKVKYCKCNKCFTNKDNASIKIGLKYIKGNSKVLSVIINTGIVGLAAGMLNSLLIVYVFKYLHQNSTGYGFLLSSKGVAMVITSLLLYKLIVKISSEQVFKVSLIGLGIALTTFPLNNIFFIAVINQFFNGIFNAGYAVARTTIIQENCQKSLLGRVFSINSMISSLTSITSLGFFGVIGEIIGVRSVLLIGGLIVFTGGIISLFLIKPQKKLI